MQRAMVQLAKERFFFACTFSAVVFYHRQRANTRNGFPKPQRIARTGHSTAQADLLRLVATAGQAVQTDCF
jgi:hypothetical protein